MKHAFAICGVVGATWGMLSANMYMFVAAVGMLTAGATAMLVQEERGKR